MKISSYSLSLLENLKNNSPIQYSYIPSGGKVNIEKNISSQIVSRDTDGLQCYICGYYAHELNAHIRLYHKMSRSEYLGEITSELRKNEKSERIKGENNPGFDHGGRLSVYSKNNPNFKEESFKKALKKTEESKIKNNSYTTRKEYYMSRGYTEEEASSILSERQRTFSREKCIKKYGDEEGIRKWEERQNKWMATLNSKPEEEMVDIIRRRTLVSGRSKPEDELFEILKNYSSNIIRQFSIRKERRFMYDFLVNEKCIIEFHGDYWHGNPVIYKSGIIKYRSGNMTVEEVWERDRIKTEAAIEKGFKFLVVWEHEWKNNRESVFKSIEEFLK